MSDMFAAVAALPTVPEAVSGARAAIDRLLRHRVLRSRGHQVSAESVLRAARASAVLDGARVDALPEAGATSLAGPPAGGPVEGGPRLSGALRVAGELPQLTRVWSNAPRQALARLHVLAAADLVGPSEADLLGRPRRPDGTPGGEDDPLDIGPPPPADEVADRLNLLTTALVGETKAPALVVLAVVHGELLALRPFGRADGVIARAAATLTGIGRSLDPKALIPMDVGHLRLGMDTYAAAARAYLDGSPAGLAAWIRHCGSAAELGAQEATAICEALSRG